MYLMLFLLKNLLEAVEDGNKKLADLKKELREGRQEMENTADKCFKLQVNFYASVHIFTSYKFLPLSMS